jgi:hypothetical protein
MHLRLDARTKSKLERAAAYEETSVTDFVLANAGAERVTFSCESMTRSAAAGDYVRHIGVPIKCRSFAGLRRKECRRLLSEKA